MDISKLLDRVKKLLLSPRSEWPVIAEEQADIKSIYLPYVLILAAVPAVFSFIKSSLIGYSAFGISVRIPVGAGINSMIVGYLLALVLVFVMALIINALAPTFGGEKNQTQALKTAAYAWTAVWVAGISPLIPWLGWLLGLAGIIYTVYLLYLGLPHTMKCPQEKAAGYTAASLVIAILLSIVIAWVVGGITGAAALKGSLGSGVSSSRSDSGVTFDKDSRLGRIMAAAEKMEEAGKRMEEKGREMERRGASAERGAEMAKDGAEALGAMMGALTGRDDGKPAEALTADDLKAFLPESVGKLERKSLSAKRETIMGMQSTTADASYGDDERTIRITLTDTPMLVGTLALASAFAQESESTHDNGYEKTWFENGNRFEEEWNERDSRGKLSRTVAERFQVEIQGNAESMKELRQIMASLDLRGMERAARN